MTPYPSSDFVIRTSSDGFATVVILLLQINGN
jgi:hypothetical protein